MNEMLEKAGRAVAIATDNETAARALVGQEPWVQEKHRMIAVAVMEAIREPNSDMIKAGEAWAQHCSDVDSLFSEMMKIAIHGPE